MNNIIYIWLSLCVKIDYLTYVNLLKIFKDEYDLYNTSKYKITFFQKLKASNIYVSYEVFSKIIDYNLKYEAEIIYLYLKSEHINIISINSKKYPSNLKNVFNPPIALFVYGDMSVLNRKKAIIYKSDNIDSKYNEICKYVSFKNISIVNYELNEFTNILILPYIKKINRKKLLIVSANLNMDYIRDYELLTGISDLLVIIKSSYNIKIGIITDLILEQGKEILTFPYDINDKEAYFSNYLIKSGCNCMISKKDLDEFI